jgi:hypothetical protein
MFLLAWAVTATVLYGSQTRRLHKFMHITTVAFVEIAEGKAKVVQTDGGLHIERGLK